MKNKRDVNGLIKALKYDDPNVRYDAAKALGRLGDPRAVEPLISALRDVCKSAAEALGKIGDSRAIEPLISVLEDKESYRTFERKAAAEALVALYHCGRIPQELKARILKYRSIITERHWDTLHEISTDEDFFGYKHIDEGIGVYFPL
jgi:DNA repair photolyase